MAQLLTLAWRNLWRNKRRTLLTLAGMVFAVAILQFFIAIQLKSYSAGINATVGMFSGHVQLQQPGYLDKPQVRNALLDPESLRNKARKLPAVTGTSIRAFSFALASSEERTYGVQIVGVDPESEPSVSSIPGLTNAGRYLASDDRDQAYIGAALAKNLKVGLGEEVTILGQGKDGSLAASVVIVVGTFESGVKDLDRHMVFVPLASFQESFSMGSQGHAVVLRLSDIDHVADTQTAANQIVASICNSAECPVALSWEELLPGLRESIELDMASGWLFYLSLMLIVGFGVANTLLMSVLERTKEFGIILALGNTPPKIGLLIFFESIVLALCGSLAGSAVGLGIVLWFNSKGFSIPGTEEIMKLWNLPSAIYPDITVPVVTIAPLVLLVTTIIAVIYPILKVLHITPVEALRSQ